MPQPAFAAILPAAGRSERFGDLFYKKPFASLAGKAVWLHSAERFLARPECQQVIVVVAEDDLEEFKRRFGANLAVMEIEVALGGTERADSIENALTAVRDEIDFIAVHDAARPCVADIWLEKVFAATVEHGAAILASPIASTIKRVRSDNTIEETVSRENLWEAQTPQCFSKDLLVRAYADRGDLQPTDDAQLVESTGHRIHVVPGSPLNIKLTTKADLKLAEQILRVLPKPKLDVAKHPFGDDDLWR